MPAAALLMLLLSLLKLLYTALAALLVLLMDKPCSLAAFSALHRHAMSQTATVEQIVPGLHVVSMQLVQSQRS